MKDGREEGAGEGYGGEARWGGGQGVVRVSGGVARTFEARRAVFATS